MSNEFCPYCGSEPIPTGAGVNVMCNNLKCPVYAHEFPLSRWNHRFVKKCTWSLEVDYGSDDRDYKTSCGQMFSFIEGGPKDNNMNFCCYCGGELVTEDT